MIDLERAFKDSVTRPQWFQHLLIGGGLLLIPIVGPIAISGLMVQVAQNIQQQKMPLVPDWSDFGQLFVKGLKLLIIMIVYVLIPLLVFALPISCIGGVFFAQEQYEAYAIAIIINSILLLPIQAVFEVVSIAALTRYVQTNRLRAALHIPTIIREVRSNIGIYLLLFAVRPLVYTLAFFGLALFIVGYLFTFVYGSIIYGHIIGQVAMANTQRAENQSEVPTTPLTVSIS